MEDFLFCFDLANIDLEKQLKDSFANVNPLSSLILSFIHVFRNINMACISW